MNSGFVADDDMLIVKLIADTCDVIDSAVADGYVHPNTSGCLAMTSEWIASVTASDSPVHMLAHRCTEVIGALLCGAATGEVIERWREARGAIAQ